MAPSSGPDMKEGARIGTLLMAHAGFKFLKDDVRK
jgi:hypothetical protein